MADEDLIEDEAAAGPRQFHIAEWYGRPFLDLTDAERLELANFRPTGKMLTKSEMDRIVNLRAKTVLSPTEQIRLTALESRLEALQTTQQRCPFRTDNPFPFCTKVGGVCSMRVYEADGDTISAVEGDRGYLRAMCPYRFHEGNAVFCDIGQELLNDPSPHQAGEVGFLESTGNLDSAPGEDVGRIDMVLVGTTAPPGHPLEWCAVEIQAVYFSGREMGIEFRAMRDSGGRATMPAARRRPDYRSSGPKRLMPQLQTKIPTLRRWGKKMIVVVDEAFFQSMGYMEHVPEISNSDVVWWLVDFVRDAPGEPFRLVTTRQVYTTLERAIEGLTGGNPVAKSEFEHRIRIKLDTP